MVATMATMAIVGMSGCASCDRLGKSIGSDMSGGFERTVILYDYQGDEIERWSGKIDLQVSTEGGHVVFDQDGERTVITGGIVVSHEDVS